jgi:hypothetical protein
MEIHKIHHLLVHKAFRQARNRLPPHFYNFLFLAISTTFWREKMEVNYLEKKCYDSSIHKLFLDVAQAVFVKINFVT